MAFIGIAAKAKKFAVGKFKAYKAQKAKDQALYDDAYEEARKAEIKASAKARARDIGLRAREDAKYGSKVVGSLVRAKRLVGEFKKATTPSGNNPWTASSKSKGPNPWTGSGKAVKNPWR